jgi:DNA-binding Xre family transcriptional regulator
MKLYRIDVYVAEMALDQNKTQTEVLKALSAYLKISNHSLRLIRNADASKGAKISKRLLKIADFFNVSIDDLLNPAAKEVLLQD